MTSIRSSVEATSPTENPGSSPPDDQRRSMTELKHLWEGMAANTDRPPKNGDVQGKVTLTWKKPPRIETKPATVITTANPATKFPATKGQKTNVDTRLMFKAQQGVPRSRADGSRPNGERSTGTEARVLGDSVDDTAGTTSTRGGTDGVVPPPIVVVRGSMLVQNSIDLVGGPPRVLDVVETTSDSDEGIVVEENTNLFHGRYFQARQNPVYFSDHEEEDAAAATATDQRDQKGRSKGNGKEQNRGGKENIPSGGLSNGQNGVVHTPRNEQSKDAKGPVNASHKVKLNGQNQKEILRIVDGSTSESVRQTITVERTEEDLTPEMREALVKDQSYVGNVVDVDVVQESVDVELSNGVALVRVVVVCERVASSQTRRREGAASAAEPGDGGPLRKTCVTVTRSTEIDMLATPDRRHVYERVMANFASEDRNGGGGGGGALVPRGRRNRLGAEDVYRLYALFVEVIATDEERVGLTAAGLGQSSASSSSSTAADDADGNSSSSSAVVRLDSMRRKGFPITLLRLGQGFLDSAYSTLSSSSSSSSSSAQ